MAKRTPPNVAVPPDRGVTCGVANGAYGARDRRGDWWDEDAIHQLNAGLGDAMFGDFPEMIRIVVGRDQGEPCGQRCFLNRHRAPRHGEGRRDPAPAEAGADRATGVGARVMTVRTRFDRATIQSEATPVIATPTPLLTTRREPSSGGLS